MRTAILCIITLVCFGTMLYYFISDWTVEYAWSMNVSLFIIGEISFGLAMGRMLRNAREYHEEFIWIEENPDI